MGKKNKLSIRILGDPVLHQIAKPITQITDETRKLADNMLEIMYEHDGVGLAGPQVGVLQRIVVLDVPPPQDLVSISPGEMELSRRMPLVLINPEIVSFSDVTSVREEGCLSVPHIFAPVTRPASVVLRSKLIDGTEIMFDCGGLLGRAIQHELDHLDGIVYVQRVGDPVYENVLPQYKQVIRKSGFRKYTIKRLV